MISGKIRLLIADFRLGREEPDALIAVFRKVVIDVLINKDFNQMPVVQPGALDRSV